MKFLNACAKNMEVVIIPMAEKIHFVPNPAPCKAKSGARVHKFIPDHPFFLELLDFSNAYVEARMAETS